MKRYDVTINGNRTTLLLSDADAAARGLFPAPAPTSAPAAPTGPVQNGPVPAKAKTPANKARKTANKATEYPPIAEA